MIELVGYPSPQFNRSVYAASSAAVLAADTIPRVHGDLAYIPGGTVYMYNGATGKWEGGE